jgi:hypothetical protein
VRLALTAFALVLAIVAFALALYAVSLTMALPASAHCFSVWRYPTPQRCALRLAQEAHPRPSRQLRAEVPPAREEGRPAPPEANGEDAARAQAIERLKLILGDSQ